MWDLFGTEHGRIGWTAYLVLWVRVAFGGHLLLSGINYFWPLVPPAPIQRSPAGPFIAQMTDMGLYGLTKLVEIGAGIALILNRFVPLALILEMPTTVSIFYLNTFVDQAPRQLYTGPRELLFNMFLIAAYSRYFTPLLAADCHMSPIWRRDARAEDGIR